MAKIIKIQDIPVGNSRLAVDNNNDFANQDNASTLLSSYTSLVPLELPGIPEEIVISGIPFSISCFQSPPPDPSIGSQGLFYALDVIENPNLRDEVVHLNTETFVLNGNRLSISKINDQFFWQMKDTTEDAVFKDNVVFSGIPLGRGTQDELILHRSNKTYDEIQEFKEVIIGGSSLTVGRIDNRHYLIIKPADWVCHTLLGVDGTFENDPGNWTLEGNWNINTGGQSALSGDLELILNGTFTDVLGPELLDDGNFSSAAAWTLTEGTTIAGGTCTFPADGANNQGLEQSIDYVLGKKYEMTYDVISNSLVGADVLKVSSLSIFSDTSIPTGVKVGHSVILTAINSTSSVGSRIYVGFASSSGTLVIDNYSIKEVKDGWIPETDWDLSGGNAAWTSGASDTEASLQQKISLVEDATYNVSFTVTTTSFANPDTYMAVQLGGGTANQIRQDGVYTIPMICGSTPTDGLQITAVNDTAGDTMTFDSISTLVKQFSPSSNLDSIFVTGNLMVPAGAQLFDSNDFTDGGNWTGDDPNDWDVVEVGDATSNITEVSGDGCNIISDGTPASITQTKCEIGKTYLLRTTRDSGSTGAIHVLNGATELAAVTNGDGIDDILFVANATTIKYESNGVCDYILEETKLYEMAAGPMDEYPWDSDTDYSSGEEALGYKNGEKVYKSVSTHADGFGDVTNWVTWMRDDEVWFINLTTENVFAPRWFKGDSSTNPTGTYTFTHQTPPQFGTATTDNGPVDHSIPTQSGTAGIKTDGTAGYVDLRTAYDYLNGLALDKFAIVSVVNTPTGNANLDRVISAETGDGAGFRWNLTASADELIQQWSGTGPKSTTLAPTDDTLHTIVDVFDIANTNGYGAVDTDAVVTDATTSALAACNVSKVVLSKLASGAANIATANYGFTAILDLSGVTTVDATFTTNLAAAIAGVTSFDPTLIAQAIYGVDNGIDGIYYSLDEASKNVDASDYYLLAYDVTDQSAKTSGYYGLTSAAGVEGITIFEEGCPFGRNRSMDTIFRGRRF